MLPERQVPSPEVALRILHKYLVLRQVVFYQASDDKNDTCKTKSSQAELGGQGWFENTERKAGFISSTSQVYQH